MDRCREQALEEFDKQDASKPRWHWFEDFCSFRQCLIDYPTKWENLNYTTFGENNENLTAEIEIDFVAFNR